VDPLELEPLYETLDPDVVNDFVESGGVPDVGGHVEFTFEGYDVTVHASGLFEIKVVDYVSRSSSDSTCCTAKR
jgi:hypothetical protein